MKVELAYGRGGLAVELPEDRTTVITPRFTTGLPDEQAAVLAALEHPIGGPPLREQLRAGMRICLSFSDPTRATPNERLIPWILDYLAEHGVSSENVTLLCQTGTHRACRSEELEQMLTADVVRRYRVLNHDCHDTSAMVEVGRMRDGTPARVNRHVAEADLRIVTGFIEPHFFAGFSGGVKGLIPGTAALETIMASHRAENIAHPQATFGVTEGNPLWEELRDAALGCGPTFLVNVTLNDRREITGVFTGDLIAAHREGTRFVRATAMQAVPEPFDVVVTSNSGAPLDLNLYQGVKGMSAAARIVKPGGSIVLACECQEGIPSGSAFEKLLKQARDASELLEWFRRPAKTQPDQWQVQIQAQVLQKARVFLYSNLPDEVTRGCHLIPCHEVGSQVADLLREYGPDARVAVLPYGPLTIPYLA